MVEEYDLMLRRELEMELALAEAEESRWELEGKSSLKPVEVNRHTYDMRDALKAIDEYKTHVGYHNAARDEWNTVASKLVMPLPELSDSVVRDY